MKLAAVPGLVEDLSDFGWLPPDAERLAIRPREIAAAVGAYREFYDLGTDEEFLAHLRDRFCRTPDPAPAAPHGTQAAGQCRWPHSPVRLAKPTWSIGAFTAAQVAGCFAWSLDRWQAESGFRWAWNATGQRPNIQAEAAPIDGNGRTLAWSYLPCGMGAQDTALQRYDSADPVLVRFLTYFRAVVLHELGHALGLEHTNDARAIMYPAARDEVLDLGGDDLPRIRALYPGAGKPPGTPDVPPAPGPVPPPPETPGVILIHTSLGTFGGRQGRFWWTFEPF